MNITSKSRYGLKIVLDLAAHSHLEKVSRKDIVAREGVPAEYLDQIMMRLRNAGLVQSLRGRCGGYRLARSPDSVSVMEIFTACEDHITPTLCVQPVRGGHQVELPAMSRGDQPHRCDYETGCVASDPWNRIFDGFAEAMGRISLSDLLGRGLDHKFCPMGGLRECRPGSRGRGGGAMNMQKGSL